MKKISSLGILAGSLILLGNSCLTTIQPGDKALIKNNLYGGLGEKVFNQGILFYLPFIQQVITYDCKLRPFDIISQTGTRDLQIVKLAIRVLQRPSLQSLPRIHLQLGKQYQQKIFSSIGNQVLRTVVAQYDTDQLLKNREQISQQIKKNLTQKANNFGIVLDDVSIMQLSFGKQYAFAIQQKAVQQQLAERQKFVVYRDQQLKTAQIIASQAQAQAALLINQAVKDYGSAQIQVKKLQAAKHIAESLSKNSNIIFVPQTNNILYNMKI